MLLCGVLIGCSKPGIPSVVIKDTPAYLNVNDAREKPSIIIRVGTECRVGGVSYGKVDAYTEVVCAGKSWYVLDPENLKPAK